VTGAPDAYAAARLVDALRRGWPVQIAGAEGLLTLLPVEGADDAALARFGDADADLLISGERAATLKLTNQRAAAAPGPTCIVGAVGGIAAAIVLADPALDLAYPMKGPFVTRPCPVPDAAMAAITLARHAGRLPAFFLREETAAPALAACTAADVAALLDPAGLVIASRARLPIDAATDAEIVGFRSPAEPCDHVALLIGHRDASLPVVRLHSECLTGDVFGSLKCDCGPQLHAALGAMAAARWGVLLYLRQEGRGIGLVNKLRAYALQDQGFDTVDANTRLGFPVEARDFGIAAAMLRLLGIGRIALMTNNPAKVERLAAEGIEVAERLPLALPANPHNAHYLATKRDRTGHQL
jgi:GTP cyclohydrolase II